MGTVGDVSTELDMKWRMRIDFGSFASSVISRAERVFLAPSLLLVRILKDRCGDSLPR